MSVETDRALFLRYCEGSTIKPLADEVGLTGRGLRDRWEARGWKLPVRRKGLLASEERAILSMAAGGRTIPEIVAATGRMREAIAALLRRKGVRAARAPRRLLKPDRWRHVLGRLLNGETWADILGPDATPNDRKREILGLRRYCASVGIPVPAAARAPLRRAA